MITQVQPLNGLGVIPIPKDCEEGYYEPIHSGLTIIENEEYIDGAIRINRTDIRSFNQVGRVGNADGSRVFELRDGRHFMLIDRYNSLNYVVGYEVVPCRKKCNPCPTNCRKQTQRIKYFARPARTSPNDIEIKFAYTKVKCDSTASAPQVDCVR